MKDKLIELFNKKILSEDEIEEVRKYHIIDSHLIEDLFICSGVKGIYFTYEYKFNYRKDNEVIYEFMSEYHLWEFSKNASSFDDERKEVYFNGLLSQLDSLSAWCRQLLKSDDGSKRIKESHLDLRIEIFKEQYKELTGEDYNFSINM